MAGVQGRRVSEAEIARIRHLLLKTEMSIPEIAARLRYSKSLIVSINRRFNIREYKGRRTCWQMGSSTGTEALQTQ
jgi:hypothetical protein